MFVQGQVFKTRNPRAVKHTQTIGTTNYTNILTVRNRRTYNNLYNQIEIEPQNLTIANESGKNVEIELRGNATPSGDTNFTNVGNNLVSDIDTSTNTMTGGRLLAAFTVGGGDSVSVNLKELEIRVPPSLKLSVSAKLTSGASSPVTAAFTYYEDL